MPATSVQPETGLIWIDDTDPNLGAGVGAPSWALLLQTVASALWYKSNTNNTAWAKVVGGGGGGGIANAIQTISAGTTNVTGPGVSFANGGGVSFGANGSTITASVAGITNGIQTISGGTTNATGAGVSFANGGGVSFGINGNTITASVASQTPETPFAIAAGTQSASTGTVTFGNAGNVTFGMAGSNLITATATVAAIKTISGGTTNATGQGVSFADGNGVSFGINGNTITASITAGIANAVRTISGGTTNMTGPGVSFADGNGVSFGINGNTVTASITAGIANAIRTISGGTTNMTGPGVSFGNGSGVTFGINGNTITASVAAAAAATFSQFTPFVGKILASYNPNQGSFWVAPYQIPNVSFSQFNALLNFTNSTNSTGSVLFSYLVGVYTKNVSTMSMLHSSSFASTIPYSGGASSETYNGYRVATMPWTSSISAGDYWIGIGISTTISSNGGTIRLVCQDMAPIAGGVTFSGLMGTNSTIGQMALGLGVWSIGTAAVPNSMAFSDIRGTLMDRLTPAFAFGVTA